MCRAATNVDRVSSEWFSRPDDERYLSLDDLFASVKGRAERSRTRTVESAAIRVEAHRDNPEKLGLVLPGADEPIAPTHWSFGQLSSLVGAPAAVRSAYLRQLPAPLAGINLQYGLTNHRAEQIKTMEVANGRTELRAVTGPDDDVTSNRAVRQMEDRIRELERQLGRKTLEVEILKEALDKSRSKKLTWLAQSQPKDGSR